MSADFWAGYASGAIGILVGNPLDIVKVRLQASNAVQQTVVSAVQPATHLRISSWLSGASAPILGYGALNALLFVTYNRSLSLLDPAVHDPQDASRASLVNVALAGAMGGLSTWIVSAPTELVKCRAQLSGHRTGSLQIARQVWQQHGIRGFYLGGGITSLRDSMGYAFYFATYQFATRQLSELGWDRNSTWTILGAGGLAGIVTWTSIFPLDVIKTRLQKPDTVNERSPLLPRTGSATSHHTNGTGAIGIARAVYQESGLRGFFRGLGVCNIRAFVVNAVQWTVYESLLQFLSKGDRVGRA